MEIIQMPRIGGFVEKGQISKKYKLLNQAVKEGELIAEVDLDTAVLELESPIDGQILYWNENTIFSDEVIAIIGKKDSAWEEYFNQWKAVHSRDAVYNKVDFFKTKIAAMLNKHAELEGDFEVMSFDEILEKFDVFLENLDTKRELKKKKKWF